MEQKRKAKPLHKDISFWIVAITLVAAADIAQIHYGGPWFQRRLRASHPAPRREFEAMRPMETRTVATPVQLKPAQ